VEASANPGRNLWISPERVQLEKIGGLVESGVVQTALQNDSEHARSHVAPGFCDVVDNDAAMIRSRTQLTAARRFTLSLPGLTEVATILLHSYVSRGKGRESRSFDGPGSDARLVNASLSLMRLANCCLAETSRVVAAPMIVKIWIGSVARAVVFGRVRSASSVSHRCPSCPSRSLYSRIFEARLLGVIYPSD
jgi:hypothetical protein